MRRLIAVLVLLSGCDLYWNHQGDDDCKYDYGYGGAPDIGLEYRNPNTGECQYFGGGGCYDACGPCAYEGDIAQAQPDWGMCYGKCDGLTEGACLTEPGCFAAYDEDSSLADAPSTVTFKGCWETAPSGPISTGSCWNLDAHECSRHDNCSAYYDLGLDALVGGYFSRCAPEPTTAGCAAVDCEPGSHCVDQCTDATPASGPNDPAGPMCAPMCVPDTYSCANVDCGPGYDCVETCNGGTPTAGGGMQPGQCYPQCVAATACEALATEAACAARGDCRTVYDGENCTCYPGYGCTCEILTYNRCETVGI